MESSAQISTLVGVVVGSSLSFTFTWVTEKARGRRDERRDWKWRKLTSYYDYLVAVKKVRLLAAGLAAEARLDQEAPAVEDRLSATRSLVAANDERGLAYESLTLIGDKSVIQSADALNEAAWGLERMARGVSSPLTPEEWQSRREPYVDAINHYIREVRTELHVPGEPARRILRAHQTSHDGRQLQS
jgi:hypothetical protein